MKTKIFKYLFYGGLFFLLLGRITASVNAANVTNYAGEENLVGGDYQFSWLFGEFSGTKNSY